MKTYALLTTVLAGLAGAGGYGVAVSTRSTTSPDSPAVGKDAPTETLLTWLKATPEQRRELATRDAAFPADLQKLRDTLNAKRIALAAALENTSSTEPDVMSAAEAVSASSAELQRRVVKYLLSVRTHLTSTQQKQLFGLCAETVRESERGRGWRHGQGGDGTDTGGGQGRGGSGRGRYRGGR